MCTCRREGRSAKAFRFWSFTLVTLRPPGEVLISTPTVNETSDRARNMGINTVFMLIQQASCIAKQMHHNSVASKQVVSLTSLDIPSLQLSSAHCLLEARSNPFHLEVLHAGGNHPSPLLFPYLLAYKTKPPLQYRDTLRLKDSCWLKDLSYLHDPSQGHLSSAFHLSCPPPWASGEP